MHNHNPELKFCFVESESKSIDLMPDRLQDTGALLMRTKSTFDQSRKLLQMLDGVLKGVLSRTSLEHRHPPQTLYLG